MNPTQYTIDNLKEFSHRLGSSVLVDCSDEGLHKHIKLLCEIHFIDTEMFDDCMGEIVSGECASAFDCVIHKQYNVLIAIRDALAPAQINYDSATGKRLAYAESAQKIVSELLILRKDNEKLRYDNRILCKAANK